MKYIASLATRLRAADLVVYLIGCILVLVSAFGPLVYLYFHAPAGTEYRFADGFFYDYYHYLMKIESGMMGFLGYYNRFTELPQPVAYGHAIFPIMGYISAAVGFYRADIVYLISRIVTLVVLFVVFYRVTRKVFAASWSRIIAFIFFFTGTSGYTLVRTTTRFRAVEPITFSGFYNALQKFPAPPQHLLASALLLAVGFIIVQRKLTVRTALSIGLLAFAIGMMQPLISIVGVIALWFTIGYGWLMNRKEIRVLVLPVILFSSISAFPVLYYAYLFSHVLPWTIWAHTTFGYNYQTDFLGYVIANMTYVPFLVFLFPVIRKLPRMVVFCLGWGVVIPTILFPFAKNGTVFSLPRLLQVQQYIPLSLVAAYGLYAVLRRFPSAKIRSSVWIFCIVCVAFAVPPWYTAIADSFAWKQPSYYNVFIPKDFIAALNFLNSKTPRESVVLTGEYMSAVIPAFTHNRVLLGRSDVVVDYDTKLNGLYAVFSSSPDSMEIQNYLKRYHVSYVIFGTDTPAFTLPYSAYTYLRPVFTEGRVTVAEVLK